MLAFSAHMQIGHWEDGFMYCNIHANGVMQDVTKTATEQLTSPTGKGHMLSKLEDCGLRSNSKLKNLRSRL